MPTSSHSTPLIALEAVVLDTETTGLDARVARLVQIGALRLRGGSLVPEVRFESLVNPGRPIPQSAITVHGITDAMVTEAPHFAAIAPTLEAFIGTAIIIGHTIQYDLAILAREYGLAGRTASPFRALDVRTLAQLAAPTLADHGLERLCEWLSITIVGRHSAIGDARAAGEVFLALVPLLRAKGIRTLAEAEAASRALAEREATTGAVLPPSPAPTSDGIAAAKIDSFLYRHRIRDVMSAPPVFAAPETTVRDAVRVLIDRRTSSVFVRAASGEVAIVTERDLLRALNADGEASLAVPIGRIANAPLQTVAEEDFLYRAIGRIQRMGFRHLGVTDAKGDIIGAVTSRNLLRHRASAAIVLGDEIDSAGTSPALAAAWAQLPPMATSLMHEEVDPRTISAVVSAEICAMTRRAAELAELHMQRAGAGSPPVPYAVLVLGSAGRGESQLAADQDNAIVYADGAEGGPEDRYFETLAQHMNETLDAAGVPLCKGGVMARNRAWRKSAADWRATVDAWVRRQRPEDLLNVDIFFDAVPVHGDARLGDTIWEHAYTRGHAARDFQNLLIEIARRRGSAFTLFGKFRTDEKGRIDLKRHGLMPIFTAARVLSIKHDVRARSSAERLRGVATKGAAAHETVDVTLDAQRTILAAVIAQQLVDTEAGVPLSPRVAPDRLGKTERAQLKAALGAAGAAVDLVSEGRI
jgi:DNA polymerase-3 subunit epsilon/CBS domain-containing protein